MLVHGFHVNVEVLIGVVSLLLQSFLPSLLFQFYFNIFSWNHIRSSKDVCSNQLLVNAFIFCFLFFVFDGFMMDNNKMQIIAFNDFFSIIICNYMQLHLFCYYVLFFVFFFVGIAKQFWIFFCFFSQVDKKVYDVIIWNLVVFVFVWRHKCKVVRLLSLRYAIISAYDDRISLSLSLSPLSTHC